MPRKASLAGIALIFVGTVLAASPAAAQIVALRMTDGTQVDALFTEAAAIGSANEIVEHVIIGPGGEVVEKVPGQLRYHEVTLKRGLTGHDALARWRALVESGDVASARRTVTFAMVDAGMNPQATWLGEGCWPASLTVSYAMTATTPAIEELVVACDSIARVIP